ncbi:hypothetical protein [Parvibium lacunae]|uniref:hypothetical protein n=1 Tax=Parvibium lacunae TaxID=1888893 RepID=UPI0011C05724|nr:hypothetical protein [Parvibium lacunae]
MLRSHFPYAATALLLATLGAAEWGVFFLALLLIVLWLPLVYGSQSLGIRGLTPIPVRRTSRLSPRRPDDDHQ